MEILIHHTVRDEILELSLEGKICHANADTVKADTERIAGSHEVKLLLVDISKVVGRPGLGEAYFMVKGYPSVARRFRIAVIDTPENHSFSSFHETVCINDGFRVKHFEDSVTARNWLRNLT
jgi:hypothetical protein